MGFGSMVIRDYALRLTVCRHPTNETMLSEKIHENRVIIECVLQFTSEFAHKSKATSVKPCTKVNSSKAIGSCTAL